MFIFQFTIRAALLMSVMVFVGLLSRQANAQTVCGERGKFLKQLKKTHHEKPSALGVSNTGQVVELLRSKNGTWSILVTNANGVTCLVAAGDAWEEVKQIASGPNA